MKFAYNCCLNAQRRTHKRHKPSLACNEEQLIKTRIKTMVAESERFDRPVGYSDP